MNISDCIIILLSSREEIREYLKEIISIHQFSYINFGTAVEPYLKEKLVEIFKKAGIIRNEEDYKVAKNKNDFPDFTLLSSIPPLAIEIKSGNHSKLQKKKWVKCKNSENDMGTINEWPKKLKSFGGENIYYLFIEYDFSDQGEQIIDVKIAPFYEFLDLNSDGLLRYREKDGNLRPKDFTAESPIKSLVQFEELFPKTAIYRSKRIINKHLKQLSSEERIEVLRSLAFQEKYTLNKKT